MVLSQNTKISQTEYKNRFLGKTCTLILKLVLFQTARFQISICFKCATIIQSWHWRHSIALICWVPHGQQKEEIHGINFKIGTSHDHFYVREKLTIIIAAINNKGIMQPKVDLFNGHLIELQWILYDTQLTIKAEWWSSGGREGPNITKKT